ncbi:receptor-like protein 9DC3 [Daucus carota subsp. sativus]|uniref:receptor-like protein 9DC3 n=1 Tax=Daucus carota subsp. sativus TaxID=79200 RepID=UPI0007EF8BCF|nr:PREDICTED: receptor like protein 30-like [Daucus carota subsp. sativus]
MEALLSLDLSSNQLTGAIPHQLTKLTFLKVLNLSGNNLTGEIPQKGQFSTFGNESYLGNPALCGLPLTEKCMHAVSPTQEVGNGDTDEDDDADDELNWEAILMGYGCGLICGLSLGYIVFKIGKPWWFVKYIKILQLKLMKTCTKHSRRKT